MTNRQSNIIFYSIISIIIYALIIHFTYPEFFEDFAKSDDERSIKAAMNEGEYNIALSIYERVVKERINDNSENNAETATIYEDMANLYSLLGNKKAEENHYLKSINIKKQLKKVNVFGFAETYAKLGSLAEEDKRYDQAQMYYEKSLSKRLGDKETEKDEGLFVGMQKDRERYLRLNNEGTITIFKKLGAIHNIRKEYGIAKNYYEKALTASKLTYEENDIKITDIKNLLDQLTP